MLGFARISLNFAKLMQFFFFFYILVKIDTVWEVKLKENFRYLTVAAVFTFLALLYFGRGHIPKCGDLVRIECTVLLRL